MKFDEREYFDGILSGLILRASIRFCIRLLVILVFKTNETINGFETSFILRILGCSQLYRTLPQSLRLSTCLNSSLTNFILASGSRVASDVVETEKLKFGDRVSCRLFHLAATSTALIIGFLKKLNKQL